MKIVLLCIGLIPFTVSGQSAIPDTTLFSLVNQSIDPAVSDQSNVFHAVTTPKVLLRKRGKLLTDIAYFTDDDLNSVANQLRNPRIVTWDNNLFTRKGHINIVRDRKIEQCLFLSLPLISQDQTVLVIYYESRLKVLKKVVASGTACVWKRNVYGEWILERQQVLWTYN